MEFALLTDTFTKAALEVFPLVEGEEPVPPQPPRTVRIFVSYNVENTYQVIPESLTSTLGRWHPLPEEEFLELADLKRAAENHDPRSLAQGARAIQWWMRPSTELMQTIDLALSLDMLSLAKQLARCGQTLFPNEKRFQRLSAVLSPPVVLGPRQGQPMNLAAPQEWLRRHASEYRNQWVAVKGGHLLGVASTLKELHEKIGAEGKTLDAIIVKVLPDGAL
jgi:hypothetical protein